MLKLNQKSMVKFTLNGKTSEAFSFKNRIRVFAVIFIVQYCAGGSRKFNKMQERNEG
jgi:hypothetical protein